LSSVLPPLAPFRYPAFARYWAGRALSMLGGQMQATALGWQVYDMARADGQDIYDAAYLLGLIGLAQFLPLLLLSLIGGQAADRYDRKLIVVICLVVKAALAASLVGIVLGAPASPMLAIFAVAAASGATNAFLPPASQALVPTLVPREILPGAIALSSLAFQGAAILGPALGGLLYGAGAAVPYTAAALLAAAAAGLMLSIRTPPHVAPENIRTLEFIREGLDYVRSNKIVLGAISLDLAVVLLAGATALMPVFARDILMAGPVALGVLRAAPAIGAAIVAFLLAVRPIQTRVGAWMFAAVGVFGLATVVFGLSASLWLSVAALAVAGAADMISVYVRQSLIQLATPDAMRGRVSAVSFVFISASNELGEYESGLVAWIIGPVAAVVAGGVGAIGVAGLWTRLFPQLARANRFTDHQV
jgi:MFS family permease